MSYIWQHLICVTVQYELFLADSSVLLCIMSYFSVQYELCLAVQFITGLYELFLTVSPVLFCSRSYLCYSAVGAISGSVS